MGRRVQPKQELGVRTHLNFSSVAKRVASIHLGEERNLPAKLLRRLAFDLGVKRLSLVTYDSELDRITRLDYTGFKSRIRDFNVSKLVVRKVARDRKAFITEDIGQYPELVGPFAKRYRTPACAAVPVIFQDELVGILCLSNLSATQARELTARAGELQSLAAQMGQLIYHWQFLQEGREGALREGRSDRGRFFEILDEFQGVLQLRRFVLARADGPDGQRLRDDRDLSALWLRAFGAAGLIRRQGGQIVVVDREGLEQETVDA